MLISLTGLSTLLVSFLIAAGTCRAAEPWPGTARKIERFNVSPFYYQIKDERPRLREIELFGPIFRFYSTPDETGWTLSPLLSYSRKGSVKTVDFFYPLGRWRDVGGRRYWRLTPFFDSGPPGEAGELPRQRSFWPLYWGRSRTGEGYGGFFPLFGTILDRYGRERIRFFLWPLFADSFWNGHSQISILWPIFTRIRGPQENGWRLFPLYGHFEKKNRWNRRFVLWPFFFKERRDLDSKRPVARWALLPFIVSETAEGFSGRTYLWPFFQFIRDNNNGFTQTDFPWPFFRLAAGPGYHHMRLWPIAGIKRTGSRSTSFFLWPLLTEEITHHEKSDETVRLQRWLLLSKNLLVRDSNGKTTERMVRIWPLWYYHRQKNSMREGFFPAVIPSEERGFQQVYGPFLRLYEFREGPGGSGRSKALWGIYRHSWNESRHRLEITIIFQAEWSKTRIRWNFFRGLLGYERKKTGWRCFLFYRPVGTWARMLHDVVKAAGPFSRCVRKEGGRS